MDKHPRFRIVDAGKVVVRYHTACDVYAGFHNMDSRKHPDPKIQAYGIMDIAEGPVGSYWYLGMENLSKLVEEECQEPEGPFCL